MDPAAASTEFGPAPPTAGEDVPPAARRCIACEYDLRGLGDEPRCPECGLLNVPTGWRRQMWDFIDRRPWFMASPFRPFQRRLPGWWWSLDRPGDVSRSARFAVAHVVVAAVIAVGAGFALNSIGVAVTRTYTARTADGATIVVGNWTVMHYGIDESVDITDTSQEYPAWDHSRMTPLPIQRTQTVRMYYTGKALLQSLAGFFAWAFWVWAGPAWVGLWTQIRRGLPDYAHPPRTIIAASNYEAHRLTYLAIGLVVLQAILAWLRFARAASVTPPVFVFGLFVVIAVWLPVYAAAGWVGPLRSDHTRQLVRSRWHAGRIVTMYAVILPLLLFGAAMFVIAWEGLP